MKLIKPLKKDTPEWIAYRKWINKIFTGEVKFVGGPYGPYGMGWFYREDLKCLQT